MALTFDDAPDRVFTPPILAILKRYQVQATFFIVGSRAHSHPDLVKRIVEEGHVVGNHSFNHTNLPKLSFDQFCEQVDKTQRILQQLTGYTPKLFRPPYGAISEQQLKWAFTQKFMVVNWTGKG